MAATQQLATPINPLTITWEKLPDNYQLDEEPVEDTGHPLIAGALRESLELVALITPEVLIASNLGICATVNGDLVIKAPDWFYAAPVEPIAANQYRQSYTPHLEGSIPSVIMEFLSHTDGGEYSSKPSYPPGKWYFYEKILQVPTYVIFDPKTGLLEVYRLREQEYQLEMPNEEGHHWIAEIGLFLGTWRGIKEGQGGYWLRWWDQERNILPWAVERVLQTDQQVEEESQRAEQERQRAEQEHQRAEQEHQRAEQERQRAEQERQRAERLAEYLRSQGINPDEIGM